MLAHNPQPGLLPCPVCLGRGYVTDDCVMFIWVDCRTCPHRTHDCDSVEAAVAAWNSRPTDPPVTVGRLIDETVFSMAMWMGRDKPGPEEIAQIVRYAMRDVAHATERDLRTHGLPDL